MNISDFLNNQYADSALYMNFRNTPSFIDGLKNSSRKIVHTIKKTSQKTQLKVSALASKITDLDAYLHADTAAQGAVVTITQSYCGSNELPVLEGIGAFGTRHTPQAAAPRYIYVKPAKYFDLLFRKEDDINLNEQIFEGEKIEPMFYVPTLPLLLVNGSIGIGVGFASTIFSRSVNNIIKLIKNYLDGKEIDEKLLTPSWHGFKGTVKKLENNKWEVKGIANINGKKVKIEEIPISWNLMSYLNFLKKQKEKGIIEKFIDYSENDNFTFDITLTESELKKDKDKILFDLGLVETLTENLVTIDENNAIKEYNSTKEIFEDYCRIKEIYFQKRIKSETKRLEIEEKLLNETFKFIKAVINDEINLKSLKKKEVEELLKNLGYINIDKLISMPLYSITEDKALEIENKWKNKIAELASMKKETAISLWKKDLKELEKCL